MTPPQNDPLAALVSIHAPARGARRMVVSCTPTCLTFQSRRLRGARPRTHSVCRNALLVLSTRLHGARRMIAPGCRVARRFQSTRPHGARHGNLRFYGHLERVSIQAPVRGATGDLVHRSCSCFGFNPRARTGRDWIASDTICLPMRFNPRARTGRDFAERSYRALRRVSIHAPARGATLCAATYARPNYRFNPRARTGRDRELRAIP